MSKPKIMFYHDGRHPLIYMYEPPMQKEEYQEAVDQLVGTPVEAINFTTGDGRTMLHETEAGELWGTVNKKWSHIIFRRAHQNAKHLIEEGNDPLRVAIDRAHAKGKLMYPVLLVQQGSGEHGVDNRTSSFRLNNKHLEIGVKGNISKSDRSYEYLDFAHEEVRKERFDYIKETINKYDVDGFELQMNYGLLYFDPNEVNDGRKIMTDWISSISKELKNKGKDKELVVRVSTSVEESYNIGLDLEKWVNDGLIDVIVGEDNHAGSVTNPNVEYNELLSITKNTDTRVHASLYSHMDSDRLNEATIESIRGAACNYWDQGVDGLYVAQWFSQWPYKASFYEKLREIPYRDIMDPKDKFYNVATSTGKQPPGSRIGFTPNSTERSSDLFSKKHGDSLPVVLETGKPVKIVNTIADDLSKWDEVDRVFDVKLRFRITSATETDEYVFKINGNTIPDTFLRKINRTYLMASPRHRIFGYWYVFKLPKEFWPSKGKNTLEVSNLKRDEDIGPKPELRDVEFEIKYLMGKNYHRSFVDEDLGPYEFANE